MLSTLFLRRLWLFLQVETIIGFTSNLPSNSKEPSKCLKVFITNPSNWRSSNLLFRKVGFLMHSQKFLGINVTSLPVSICISKSKLLILTFNKKSFFFSSIFSTFCYCFFFFYWKYLHIGFVFFNSFNVFLFEFAYCLKTVFLSNLYKSSQILDWFPHPVYKIEADCFRITRVPETSRTFPSGEGRQGVKETQGRAWYGKFIWVTEMRIQLWIPRSSEKMELDRGLRNNKEWGRRRPWRLITRWQGQWFTTYC